MKVGDKFYIIKNTKSYIISLESILNTFPKKDFLSRNKIYDIAIDLLEDIIKANHEKDINLKHSYQISAIGKIGKLDFALERAYKFKYISEKQCLLKSQELSKINRMIYAWYLNDK